MMSLVPMVSLLTLHALTVVLSLEQFKLDRHVPIQWFRLLQVIPFPIVYDEL